MIDKSNWSPTNFHWLVGLLEGECYVGFTAGSLRIECEMTDEDVVRSVHYIAGFGTVSAIPSKSKERKPTWRWQSKNQSDVANFLQDIFFFMGERRQNQIYSAMEARFHYELTARTNIKRVFSDTGRVILPDQT
jgi:hypothetical protein